MLTEPRPHDGPRTTRSPARSRRFGGTNTGGLVLLTAVTWAVYTALGQGFLSSFNLFALSQIAAQYAVIGFAQLAVLVLGRMNLAVGSVGVVVVMFTGWMVGPLGINPVVGIVAGLLLGAVAGALMGWLELKTGLDSFIVTLAVASVLSGAVLILSGGKSVSEIPPSVIEFGAAPMFTPYLSLIIIPAAIIAVGLWYMYTRSALGWKLLAVGANERSAELSGVRIGRAIVISFGLSGLLCAVAAVMEMSRVAAALPSLGVTWLLTAFIVPVLGGNPLRGGSVSVGGAVIAAVFVASIDSGLVSLDVPAYWQQLTLSLVLLVAVVVDELRRRKARREPPQHQPSDEQLPESEPADVR